MMEKPSKMLIVSSCLFCVNSSTSIRKFKITEDYGGGNTIRYDLTNFLGHQIEPYLKDDDLLCSNCMNFFENMAYTKRRLIDFLRNRDESEDIKMQGFSDIWKGFKKFAVTLVKFNLNDSDETWDAADLHNRSLTPNPLVHTYSEPYNQAYERKISEFERVRSKSTALSEIQSETDLEVRQLFGKRKRRKKRGHNWTRRRGEQKSRALSRTYPDIYDSYERNCYSTMIRQSSYHEPINRSKSTIPGKKRSVEGYPVKTRSTSRLESYLANVTAEKELSRFYCEEINCSMFFEKLENFVLHKRYDHNIIARFPCQQCRFKATTNAELVTHTTKTHDLEVIMCFQCKAEIQGTVNLQEHLQKHQEYSIGCNFCYLRFLSKSDLVEHVSKEHQGKNRKKIHEKKSFVFQAVVNEEKVKEPPIKYTKYNFHKKDFAAIVLRAEKSPSPELEIRSIFKGDVSVVNSVPITISDISQPITISDVSQPITVISDFSVHDSVPNRSRTMVINENESNKTGSTEPPSKSISDVAQSDVADSVVPTKSENNFVLLEDNLQLNHMIPVVVLERLDSKKC